MSLTTGTRLGPYEVLAPIGAGGMGEVWKARDTRLDRTVAIKILPSHLSQDIQSRERLEREARAVSSLSHPNICTLHDIGREDGIDFLVMEYLEGETLAQRLQKGPLPLDRGLHCAIEIAKALSHAHGHGIIHRDLKPANIMLTRSGTKLLDFGLAKIHATRATVAAATQHSVQTRPLTRGGTILGTIQYMAPEQLEGKEADARTDLFAFGAVLYEMITGRRAFQGDSAASLIAAIMSAEPLPLCKLQKLSPAALEHLVTTCLIKNPDERRQAAHDVVLELQWIAGAGAEQALPQPGTRRRPWAGWRWAVAGTVLVALFTGLAAYFTQADYSRPAMAFTIHPLKERATRITKPFRRMADIWHSLPSVHPVSSACGCARLIR